MSPFDPAWAETPPGLADPVMAAVLLAVDPAGLGGIVVRAWSGPARSEFVAGAAAMFPAAAPRRKMPLNISEDRLAGGLDLAATLSAGRPVQLAGMLAEARGGVLTLAMAERLGPGVAARIAAAMEDGEPIAVIALDEGQGPDEAPPAGLTDRLAFTVAELPDEALWPDAVRVVSARQALSGVTTGEAVIGQICALASMFGVASFRACLFAQRAARAAAAWRGAVAVAEEDVALAARLVLKPRATLSPQAEPPAPEPEPEPEQPDDAPDDQPEPPPVEEQNIETLQDKVDAAADARLPPELLAALLAAAGPRRIARGAGTSGATQSLKRGRPVGARAGALTGDARLSLLDTLRAAAPWQKLRITGPGRRIAVRAEDFRVRRFKEKPRRIAIFAVDASGSSALNRLAEAKGAIQLLLAECYVQRDEVALLAFRGQAAEILLPPTHALARVRRALAALPGGGPTPLAAGINAGVQLAAAERRKGHQPLLVLLTDGGANIAADGTPGRAAAGRDALAAGKAGRVHNIPTLVVDTAPRRQAFVRQLAADMGGRYLPLPYADANALSAAVQDFGGVHASRKY